MSIEYRGICVVLSAIDAYDTANCTEQLVENMCADMPVRPLGSAGSALTSLQTLTRSYTLVSVASIGIVAAAAMFIVLLTQHFEQLHQGERYAKSALLAHVCRQSGTAPASAGGDATNRALHLLIVPRNVARLHQRQDAALPVRSGAATIATSLQETIGLNVRFPA